GELNRPQEESDTYQALIDRFGDATRIEFQRNVAKAQVYQGMVLGQLRGFNVELHTYDRVIDRLEGTADDELSTTLAMALIKKGIVLGWMGHTDAEMA